MGNQSLMIEQEMEINYENELYNFDIDRDRCEPDSPDRSWSYRSICARRVRRFRTGPENRHMRSSWNQMR